MFSACEGTQQQSFSWQNCICKRRFTESKEAQDLKHTVLCHIQMDTGGEDQRNKRENKEKERKKKHPRETKGWQKKEEAYRLRRWDGFSDVPVKPLHLRLLSRLVSDLSTEIKSCHPWRPQRKSSDMFWNSQQHKGLTESAGKIPIPELAERAEWLNLYYILKACTSLVMAKHTLLSS